MEISVAGAGIAGLTAAIALARRGHKIDIHEKSDALSEIGAGIQISPNAFRLLAELGLGERLIREGAVVEAVELRDGRDGRTVSHVPFGDLADARYGAPYCVVHRGRLQTILLDAATSEPAVSIHLGSPAPILPEAPVTVAADGHRSAIREKLMGISSLYTGLTAWRSLIDAADWPGATAGRVTLWMAPRMHLVAYPLGSDDRINLVAIGASESDEASLPGIAGPGSDWLTEFCRRLQPTERAWSAWPLHTVQAPMALPSRRLALIGDAAHAMEPYAAQGGALAIEDSWVLAQCLDLHSEPEAALRTFRRAREPRVARVRRLAQRNGRIYHLSSLAALARNLALAAIEPARLLSGLDWLYGWKP